MIGRIVRFVLLLAGWVLLAAAAVAVWLHRFPSRGEITVYLTSAVPFALIAGVVALVIFAATRRWILLALAVAVTAALCYGQAPLFRAQAAPAGEPITVVSANLLFGGADVDALASQVRAADADLLSVQEMTPEALERLRDSPIGELLPYDYAVPGHTALGTGLFSRTPLSGQAEIEDTVLHNLGATTDLPGAPGTRVFALHPGAPLPGRTDIWRDDLAAIDRHLTSVPQGPIIAAGDFNATWDHIRYRGLLDQGLVDATDQAGAGFSPTYPTDRPGGRPVIAIDRVMSRGFVATSLHTFDLPGSDHRGVVVTLVAP
ncbi:endonuclease/exonuclease/phosphatase family protein [Gordonia sp. PKS22-38]|uniref:Endonuclease/exonuclease/phosphatase family protein n=1 Tax=Gordonia prachuapensis TaxID=3115651 RepID=A0ABU7MSL7_9ACTN|nr:endonuclease/exonuclease/phosphatase family protein [Gordonia sp. PKS22-38]